MSQLAPTSLLEARDYYKPFRYPWAYQAYKVMQSLHWLPHEAPMAEDVKDWAKKLTPSEKSLLTQLFRFFTQADVDVARGYFEKYGPKFPHPEVRMMLASFMAAEANHIDAYATLIDTLGLPEVEFKAFLNYQAMREKHEYMFEREQGKSISDLVVDIAVFSAFGEGMQLFSSFALLMSFQRRGLMKGMTTIVEWSIRDETHHVESMIKLLHELIKEHPRVWNDETKKRIYDACRAMVKLEDAFIDQAFALGPVEGVTPEEAKQYIRYIADRRLLQLGLKPNYGVKTNPFDWLDWIMNAPTHTNFFEGRSTEYGKGETPGWDHAFAFLDRSESLLIEGGAAKVAKALSKVECLDEGVCEVKFTPIEAPPIPTGPALYRVYTKPLCPHCTDAKKLLTDLNIGFEVVEFDDTRIVERRAKFAEIANTWDRGTWNTSPMVFAIGPTGEEVAFIGGASDLHKYLNA